MDHPRANSQGFSMVELMVGVVIAIIASIIMFQVFAFSERQKRVVVGSADAQVNGAIALDIIEREVRMAGFGLAGVLENCNQATTFSFFDPEGDGSGNPIGGNLAQPLVITQGVNGPDTIQIGVSGSDFTDRHFMGQSCLRADMAPGAPVLTEGAAFCAVGNMAVVVQQSPRQGTAAGTCTAMQITGIAGAAPVVTINHDPATTGQPNRNPSATYLTANNWPTHRSSIDKCEAYVLCLPPVAAGGDLGLALAIDVSGTPMQRALLSDGNRVAPAIIDMQAEYVYAGGPGGPTTGNLGAGDLSQLRGIRVALLARSGEFEKPEPGGQCATTTDLDPGRLQTWATFSTNGWPQGGDPSLDWRCYRYKVFETVIPLRNHIWARTST